MSQRSDALKSHGTSNTMSPRRIQTLRRIFPRILPNRVMPSAHFTIRWSLPTSFTTWPYISPSCASTISLSWASFRTFLLPNLIYQKFVITKIRGDPTPANNLYLGVSFLKTLLRCNRAYWFSWETWHSRDRRWEIPNRLPSNSGIVVSDHL
jgi:hypothetical protein